MMCPKYYKCIVDLHVHVFTLSNQENETEHILV